MAKGILGPGVRTLSRARPYDVFVVVKFEGTRAWVSHELRLSKAVMETQAFYDARRPDGEVRSAEIWLEGVVCVFVPGGGVDYVGKEPSFPVSPGRYRWVQPEGADDGAWKRLGRL